MNLMMWDTAAYEPIMECKVMQIRNNYDKEVFNGDQMNPFLPYTVGIQQSPSSAEPYSQNVACHATT